MKAGGAETRKAGRRFGRPAFREDAGLSSIYGNEPQTTSFGFVPQGQTVGPQFTTPPGS